MGRNFGSMSKSEFSFMSDRTSFAASLNTLSEHNSMWILDPDEEQEQKFDFSKDENSEHPQFTFGGSNKQNFIQSNTVRKMSASETMNSRHSKAASSITFSSTVSMFTDHEKRKNSLLFYDLWGVPATRARSGSSMTSNVSAYSQNSDFSEVSHIQNNSGSLSGFLGRLRKQSTMVSAGPINENQEEEWSADIIELSDEED